MKAKRSARLRKRKSIRKNTKKSNKKKKSKNNFGTRNVLMIENTTGINLINTDILVIENLRNQSLHRARINRIAGDFIFIITTQNIDPNDIDIVSVVRNHNIIWESGTHKENERMDQN